MIAASTKRRNHSPREYLMIISLRIWLTPSIRERYQAEGYLFLQVFSRDLFARSGTRSDRENWELSFYYGISRVVVRSLMARGRYLAP